MKIEEIDINLIKPYINNPRKKLNIDKVASSIQEFGFQQPIVVDKNYIIIVGHTRYEASKKLDLKTVPITIANLTKAQAKAYRIADNRLNEDSKWDSKLLNIELKDLLNHKFDINFIGFTEEELKKINDPNIDNSDFNEIIDTLKTKNKCPSCGFEFD